MGNDSVFSIYFPVVQFIMLPKAILNFESVNEIVNYPTLHPLSYRNKIGDKFGSCYLMSLSLFLSIRSTMGSSPILNSHLRRSTLDRRKRGIPLPEPNHNSPKLNPDPIP